MFTDGLPAAGLRRGQPFDIRAGIERLHMGGLETAQTWADQLLSAALVSDDQRPANDISILVLAVLPRRSEDPARRMLVRVPL